MDAVGAGHVQGAFDEGQPANQERPVLIAGKSDTTPNATIRVPVVNADGSLNVVSSGGGGGTVNQGTPNAGGALAWPVRGGILRTVSGTMANISATVTIDCHDADTVFVQINNASTFVGNLGLLVNNDGLGTTNATNASFYSNASGVVAYGISFGPDMIAVNCAGLSQVIVAYNSYTSGVADVTLTAAAGTAAIVQDSFITLPAGNALPADAISAPRFGQRSIIVPPAGVSEFAGPALMNTIDGVWDFVAGQAVSTRNINIFKPQNAVAIAAETTIWTPAAGKSFRLMGYCLACSVSGNVILRDNTAGTVIAVIPCLAGQPISSPPMGNGILSAAANHVLTAQGPAASTLSGSVFGTEE